MAEAALALRVFHLQSDQLVELPQPPPELPARGFVWIGISRTALEAALPDLQAALQRWTGSQLVDLHVSDLLNTQLPSHFDYTSRYDTLVFQRLVATSKLDGGDTPVTVKLQEQLINPHSHFSNWRMLLESRNALHALEDTCEDQRSAM